MNVHYLALGDDEYAQITELGEWAAAHPVEAYRPGTYTDVMPARQLELPGGYTIAYSVEKQPIGPCRHLSVSLALDSDPHPVAVGMLMRAFGFINPLGACLIFPTLGQNPRVLNILEPVDGNMQPLAAQRDELRRLMRWRGP